MSALNVLVAGFHHETNTYAPSPADWAAFNSGAGYPPYARGAAMLALHASTNSGVGGFAEAAAEYGWTLLPSAWGGAMPSNRVTTDAFERICADILEDVRRGGFDAIFLDLHGAGVAECADDAEGELLARIRAVVGPQTIIVATLDLHANVTARMLALTTAMTAYRTYPHVDMRTTGVRAARLLARRIDAPARAMHAERVPFLLPLNAQCTLMQPAQSIIEQIVRLEAQHDVELSFAMGFSAADFAECGPVLFGYGADAAVTRDAVRQLHREVSVTRRLDWKTDLLAPDDAVERAIALAQHADAPVVIADTQDNPGAGGDSNTTGMLRALLAARAGERLGGRVALGLLFDPESARAACAAGVGATVQLELGRAVPTWDGTLTDAPVAASARVLAVSDGIVALHGPMAAGMTARLGPSACVEVDGVRVLLASAKMQLLDLGLCRYLGVEPAEMKLIVAKSSVHFRAAFAPIASTIMVAKAPGPMAADPGDLPWTQLPPTTAVRP